MKNKITCIVLILLFVQISFGQASFSKEILGQVFEKSTFIEGVNIINNSTQITTVSDANGMFSIMVKEGDVLVFSSVHLNPLKLRISADDLKLNSLQVKMTAKEIELKEVIVNENAHITAENLGIIPYGQKKYTPAERKLVAGSSFLGAINGNNKILQKNVEVEKKENNVEQLGYLFEDAYYVDYLKIPLEHLKGFKYFVVENEYANLLLKSKNKQKLSSLLNELSLKYNEIIELEK